MHFLKKSIFVSVFNALTILLGIFAGFFSDIEKSYEFNRCLFSSRDNSEIIGGSVSYESFNDFKTVIDSWQSQFEVPLLRNCKSVLDTNDSISFIETEPYEHDSKYNTFKIYSQADNSWQSLNDNKIFISSQLCYSRFGNRDYNQAIGKTIIISDVEYVVGGVFFVNHNENAKRIISDYFIQEIGECVFVGKSFFETNTPSRTLITFETSNKSVGEIYLSIVDYFSKNGLRYSLFNNSDIGRNLNSKIDSLNSFYSSFYKVVLAVLFNVCFAAVVIFSFAYFHKSKIKTPLILVSSALIPSLLVLLLRELHFSTGLYLLNKTSMAYIIFSILLFSMIPIYNLLKIKSEKINVLNTECYEEINI